MPNGKYEDVVSDELVVHDVGKASKLSPSCVAIYAWPNLRVPFNLCDAAFETLDEFRAETRASLLVPPTRRANIISSNTTEGGPSAHSSAQS